MDTILRINWIDGDKGFNLTLDNWSDILFLKGGHYEVMGGQVHQKDMSPSVKLILGYMKVTGLNQQEIAALLETNAPQICRWLTGIHNPCRAWQYRIAHILGDIKEPKVGKMERLDHTEK